MSQSSGAPPANQEIKPPICILPARLSKTFIVRAWASPQSRKWARRMSRSSCQRHSSPRLVTDTTGSGIDVSGGRAVDNIDRPCLNSAPSEIGLPRAGKFSGRVPAIPWRLTRRGW